MAARVFSAAVTAAAAAAAIAWAFPVAFASAGVADATSPATEVDACREDDPLTSRVEAAIESGSRWLLAYEGELNFDAAVMLSQIRLHADSDALRQAFARARVRAEHDHDHPHLRFWMPEFRSPPEHTSRWEVPDDEGRRVNTNRVISEALHCAENGWRASTEAYVCGRMRDGGGYHSTHAIWALDIARRAGCLAGEACLPSLRAELAAAQPKKLEPATTLDIDLYAERALMLLRTGTPAAQARGWVDALVLRQGEQGDWGVGEDANPYFRFHATAMTVWALAEWRSAVRQEACVKIHVD